MPIKRLNLPSLPLASTRLDTPANAGQTTPGAAAPIMALHGPRQRKDPAWAAAAAAYIKAKRDVAAANWAEREAKEALVALTDEAVAQGCGVVVRRIPGWTPDLEAEAARDIGIDLARHFGKGCFGVTITLNE